MSSRDISKMVPKMVDLYYAFHDECDRLHLEPFVVTCTTRTVEEQTALVKSGASRTMNSKHITGQAFDICVMKNGKASWKYEDYVPFGKVALSIGLDWGGSKTGKWKKFVDADHIELKDE